MKGHLFLHHLNQINLPTVQIKHSKSRKITDMAPGKFEI